MKANIFIYLKPFTNEFKFVLGIKVISSNYLDMLLIKLKSLAIWFILDTVSILIHLLHSNIYMKLQLKKFKN